MKQIELHNRIKSFLFNGPETAKADDAKDLVGINFDARNYFFVTATIEWFDWLWESGLLDVIKTTPVDEDQQIHRMPEMDYLVRMGDSDPEKTVRHLLTLKINKQNHNKETVSRIIWLMSGLPAKDLALLVKKMKDEKWLTFANTSQHSGFHFEKMFTRLIEANDWNSVLILAEALLIPRTKEEIKASGNGISTDNPFYIHDLKHSNLFSHLSTAPDAYAEELLKMTTRIIGEVILNADKEPAGKIFTVGENFHLFDVDLFTLEVDDDDGFSSRNDVKKLVAIVKKVIQNSFENKCDDAQEVKRLLREYIAPLPDTRSMWRLRLYAYSRCPKVFSEELKLVFNRLFEVEDYHEIDSGTEYQKALRVSFDIFNDSEQRKYVENVFSYFTKKVEENKTQSWHKRNAWEILSSISDSLSDDEKVKCKEVFGFDVDAKYEPTPNIGKVEGGTIRDKSPVQLTDYKVSEIIQHLKSDWSPEVIKEQYRNDSFLTPRSAEGLGNAIKDDFKERTEEYLEVLSHFFDRDVMHPQYTYSVIRGIEEMVRDQKIPKEFNWGALFGLFDAIKESGETSAFTTEIEDGDTWLARWVPVHDALMDTLLNLLTNSYDDIFPFEDYRKEIFSIIKYCLTVGDPKPENETSEYGDLHGVAINSVRGRAFQVLTNFIFYDGKSFPEKQKAVLKDDVKLLYVAQLKKETSKAVRYMFGHYVAPYYFRDKEWFVESDIFGLLFAKDDLDLYFSSWEGYLTASLHEEFLGLLEDEYSYALALCDKDYPDRKYVSELDKAIATHLALAYAHYETFTFESKLFKELWSSGDEKKQQEFVSFLGRHCAFKDEEWLKENKVDVQKLKDFWDWCLKNVESDKALSGFGLWVNRDDSVFEMNWLAKQMSKTVVKARGNIDWDYGIIQHLTDFASVEPEATLIMLESFLLDGEQLNPHRDKWMIMDREIPATFEALYENEDLRLRIYDFIDQLIAVGGEQFWSLKKIVGKD